MSKTNKERGFTIVELLIVIVVIAILAAISIVAYSGIQNRAKASSGQQLASTVEKKAQSYYTVNNAYPADQAGFANVTEAKLEGNVATFVTTVAALSATSADGGKVIAYEPCGVSGSTATGAKIAYWDYAANPAIAKTVTLGSGC